MCGGSKNVTSTTNTEPPAYLAGPLKTAADAAVKDFNTTNRYGAYRPYPNPFSGSNLFGGTLDRIGQQYANNQPGTFGGQTGRYVEHGGDIGDVWEPYPTTTQPSPLGHPAGGGTGSQYPGGRSFGLWAGNDIGHVGSLGYPGAGPGQPTLGQINAQNAQNRIAAHRASSGQDLISQSRGLTGASLGGAFLHPESNPYLASTFNRAADLTRTRLDSEFAGAGRNLGASMPARSEELQTLASNLFGQNYQAERDRQLASQGQAQELDPINLLINRLAGITPGAGGKTTATQPIIRTGIF